MSPAAKEAWISATERFIANPSSPHRLGSRADVALSAARQEIASHLGCGPYDIIFTSGATEANNAILHHLSRIHDGPVWISAIEHPSVMAAAERWFPRQVTLLNVTPSGQLDLDFLAKKLKRTRPAAVAMMAANNETGVIQPWSEALKLCIEHSTPFFCDAAQWVGKQPSHGLGQCDFLSGCAHKFGGPLGIGFMKVPGDFKPFIVGGPQEGARRAGTENVASALSMASALTEREGRIRAGGIEERTKWRDEFVAELKRTLPEVEALGLAAHRLWNTVAALMPATPDCRKRWVSGADAYAKIRAGAQAVQFYSAMVYGGPGLVTRIKRDLAARLRSDGFGAVAQAVGAK
jgi:cysteine desulfurase